MIHVRKLGNGEELWARSSQKTSNNFLMVIQLAGTLPIEQFTRAFLQASLLYPILGAKVREFKGQMKLEFGSPSKTKLQTIVRKDSEHWQSIAEQEMNRHLPPTEDQLWTATLLHGELESELILTFNHLLGDGKSGQNFIRSLLEIYSSNSDLIPRRPHPPVNQLLNRHGMSLARGKNISRYIKQTMTLRKKNVYVLPESAKPQNGLYGSTKLISESIDPGLAKLLQKAARAEGTTLHGIICAALLIALREFSGAPSQELGVASAINLRSKIPVDHEDDFGFFVGSIELVRTVESSTDIWQLARSLSQSLKDDIAHERPLFDGFLRGLILKKHPDFDAAAAVMRSNSKSTVHVTNLGRLEFPQYEGSLQVKHCFHVPSCHFLSRPYLVLACVSVHDVLKLNFTYPHPYFKQSQALQIIERFKDILMRLPSKTAAQKP